MFALIETLWGGRIVMRDSDNWDNEDNLSNQKLKKGSHLDWITVGVEDIEEEGEEELAKGREGGESTLVRWGVLPGRYLCKY